MTSPKLGLPGGYLLFSIPSSDAPFSRAAAAEISRVRSDGERLPTARQHLRQRYPQAQLHRQRDVLVGGIATEAWFAFRDGRNQPTCPTDSWWRRSGAARATVHSSGRLTDVNHAFRAIFGMAPHSDASTTMQDGLPTALGADLFTDSPGLLPPDGGAGSDVVTTCATPTDMELHARRDGHRGDAYEITVRTFQQRDATNDKAAMRASSVGVLSGRRAREMARGSNRREMAHGERLSEAVVGGPWVVLVVCGIVRLYVATDGIEPTVLYAGHGSLLGTHWSRPDDSLALGLQAVTPARVVQFDPRRVQQVLDSDAGFASAVENEARVTLRDLMQTYAARSSGNLGRRLAREILRIWQLQTDDPLADYSLVPVTEQQLADGLGSIRESVARAIGTFRDRGLVATTRFGVVPLDPDALRAEADSGDA